ncbi:Mu homology domain-containing protein [Gloeopeniophorella convolvens]|nr:Mu homology domain-containing protein [Gloeopeniophorella convolvens]
MAIDGLIILDLASGRPIVQTAFRSHPPAYPLLHIDAYNAALAKAPRPEDVDPVLPIALPDTPTALCHVQHPTLAFLCPISGDLDPLYAFAFLRTFLDILADYLGTPTAPVLRDHFDIVHQLLEETLDTGGHPLTTAPNALRDIVLPPSLTSKVLAAAGVAGVAGLPGAPAHGLGAFASPIPWRKAGVRYNTNEIYFDLVETLRAVVGRGGALVTGSIAGRVESNCKLSGTPDLLLTLANSHTIADPAFHACVRLSRWAQSKTLSFVPPDGRFTLMEYRVDPAAAKPGATTAAPLTAAAAAQTQVQVPFTLRADLSVSEHGGTFDLSLAPRRALAELALELDLGTGTTSASCTGGGSWAFLPARHTLRWTPPATTTSGAGPRLQGTFVHAGAGRARPARAVQVAFTLPPGALHSSLKVDGLKMAGETYKPYKGVRGRAEGRVEWRVEWKGG